MDKRFNELITLAEAKKKKGGSLGAVFKLIQDLTDFEEKIQDAMDAQEMAENRSTIESFLGSIDQMYEKLLNIAKSGIQSLRSERNRVGLMDDEGEEVVVEEEEVVEERPRPSPLEDIIEKADSVTDVITPKPPRM